MSSTNIITVRRFKNAGAIVTLNGRELTCVRMVRAEPLDAANKGLGSVVLLVIDVAQFNDIDGDLYPNEFPAITTAETKAVTPKKPWWKVW